MANRLPKKMKSCIAGLIHVRVVALCFAFCLWFSLQALSAAPPWLSTSGTNIVNSSGATVVLRGINLGGAYEIEPWMSSLKLFAPAPGMPAIQDEVTLWEVLTQRFGSQQTQQLQQTWRSSWLSPADIYALAGMGATVVRIPFFYQMLQDDSNPGQLIPAGTALLDSILEACAQAGVYAILDLHGAPGGQSANLTTGQAGLNQLFTSTKYQQQTVQLWQLIAAYYQNHPEIAGYDLLNEPLGAPNGPALVGLYSQIYAAIRAVDTRHIVFMEDGYKGLAIFPNPQKNGWTNICYSLHVYHLGAVSASVFQNDVTTAFPHYQQQLANLNAPLYIGEFGTAGTLLSRSQALALLPLYTSSFNDLGWSWTPWTYKVIDPLGGDPNIWGLYTNKLPWNEADPYNDSFSTLQLKFSNYATSTLQVQTDLQADLEAEFSREGASPAAAAAKK
jgi:hypothetical protein